MTTANYLTLSRIILLPFFLLFFFSSFKYHYIAAGLVFMISGLTDFFDGYIARKYDQVSKLGRILDPLADKLTVIAVFVALAIKDVIPSAFILIILIREFIILFGSIFFYYNNDDIITPSKFGKTSTFLLYISAASYILDVRALKLLIFVALPLTILSGVDYCIQAYQYVFNK